MLLAGYWSHSGPQDAVGWAVDAASAAFAGTVLQKLTSTKLRLLRDAQARSEYS
jgi:hypothetical protein